MPQRFRCISLSALLFISAAVSRAAQPAPDYDVIIRNGTIVDGSGGAPFRADVAVAGARIAAVGTLRARRAELEIDAAGLVVAPGFINIHSHAAPAALPRAENMLRQGVTTEILNSDGGGPADITAQLTNLQSAGLAINIGAYIGFNAVWSNVVGQSDRRPTIEDVERMRALITAGLEAGAWGVSSGLDYKPAYFASTEEVIDVVSAASKWRTNFINHERLTPELKYSSRAGIAETMLIGDKTGLVPVITHMKVTGGERGTAPVQLAAMRRATMRGRFVAADVYPYLAGQTGLGALIIPAWAQDGGRQAMLARFADPELRGKIAAEAEQTLQDRFGGFEGIYLPSLHKKLIDVMAEMQAPVGETVIRLLERASLPAILPFGAESDLRAILRYPETSIACDCGATTSTTTHPRNYGSFPRVLGRYVREEKVLTLQDAVRKMTALPAATIGMVDRGRLAVGMIADIVVFDPKTVIDHATYENPALMSEGVVHVFVNGKAALQDAAITDVKAGRALFRRQHMPSRPMNTTGARRFVARDASVSMSVSQAAGARRAAGSLRVREESGAVHEMVEFGVLQTMDGWTSVTGRLKTPPGAPRLFATITIDRSNPLVAGKGGKVTVEMD